MSTKLTDYMYYLPDDLVAAYPLERRDASRLLVLDRRTGGIEHSRMTALPGLLEPSDVLVLNDVKVIPARLEAVRPSGGRVEILLVGPEQESEGVWSCLLNPSRRMKVGVELSLQGGFSAVYLGRGASRQVHRIQVKGPGKFESMLHEHGKIPLPPYILKKRGGSDEPLDRDRYQTVYARRGIASAAPTAGLHFTTALLDQVGKRAEVVRLTLNVGPGTFLPVRADDIKEHRMHREDYNIPLETAQAVNRAKAEGRRVVAVGTTVVRALESAWSDEEGLKAGHGSTDLFLYPGCSFKVVDAMLTNFHLPGSTLLMLVSAFAGRENVLAAYKEAVSEKYRFYSYGDAMFVA